MGKVNEFDNHEGLKIKVFSPGFLRRVENGLKKYGIISYCAMHTGSASKKALNPFFPSP